MIRAALAICAVMVGALSCVASPALPLRFHEDLSLPGNTTRFDYQSLDATRHLLFIAHLGDSSVLAVDTRSRRVVANVPHVESVHGVLAVPQLGIVYASATGTNEVVAIDEKTFAIVARASAGVYPDGMAFDPGSGRLFISDERGRSETVVETHTHRRIATIALGGEAGNTQYDPISKHIFVNVQTLGQIVEIDPAKSAIVRRIGISGGSCVGNHGLLIDEKRRRAFVACEDSNTFLWIDMQTMHVIKEWAIGETPDVLALDRGTNRVFVASESGTVSVFADAAQVTRVAQAFLAPGAHTVAVDPQSHAVYFPLEDVGGKPVLRIFEQYPER